VKLKRWIRRRSIPAPRMTIRTSLSWPVKLAAGAVVLGLAGAVAMWTYDLGRDFGEEGAPREPVQIREPAPAASAAPVVTGDVAVLRQRLATLEAERESQSAGENAAESQLNMERSARRQLSLQVNALEQENAKLKEDLAFFEKLLPVKAGASGITIRQFKADLVSPTQLQYQVLVMQGARNERDFTGNLQIVATVVQAGREATLVFPETQGADAEGFKFTLRHYQRLEGLLNLPAGVVVKSLQARVLENGKSRVQETIRL
jgi:hypothetical protein